ncbi:hypothetical protein BaRGS_00012701 [Batillaria attramentaria]|uniref:Uncharacterized protein n=1 Tax=Batillaria attramentaria TaxID=370345 RepID=A0ABD0L9X5_9CAEN
MAATDVKERRGSGAKRNSSSKGSSGMAQGGRDDGQGGQTVEFNLSDPDQLLRQLESVDLTEEESDKLLNEAYKVNKKLREMLQQQEAQAKAAQRSQSADSHVSYKPKHSVLPPITRTSPLAGATGKSASGTGHGKASTAHPKGRNKSAKSKTPTQRTERPAWDDRFSFS